MVTGIWRLTLSERTWPASGTLPEAAQPHMPAKPPVLGCIKHLTLEVEIGFILIDFELRVSIKAA